MLAKRKPGEISFDLLNTVLMVLLSVITLYPMVYVLFASLSEPSLLVKARGFLFYPKGFSLDAYKAVLENPMIMTGYKNTLFYVIVGTSLNLLMTTLAAYGLSRKNVMWKNPIMFMIVFTMFFSGGLIPSYLLIQNLHMMDTRWALIVPGAMSAFNMIVMRTSFQGIPDAMEESARMEGASDWTILFRIIVPLSMPVIAVMILFYGVSNWNSWFAANIYLRNRDLVPLQIVLRDILISNDTDNMMQGGAAIDKASISYTIKYATIIVSTLPILLMYPFLQKYFVQGVLIGALKE
ncbi:carbohydrate ABC transporter permease [Paenibacillus hodogayensis]|uniref:Carbohydrate ABC transporter permease n=1 Tax=Paenibacillus hodogayensis TaxID=279208 RepID=A0ABV5W6L8_9BACL